MTPKLVVTRGPLQDEEFELEDSEFSVGRAPSNRVFIPDNALSRKHCLIRKDAEGWTVVDLGSSNGTLVNNRPVTECRLRDRDEIVVGGTTLVAVLSQEPEFDSTLNLGDAGAAVVNFGQGDPGGSMPRQEREDQGHRKLAAIMFTDIVGYSALTGRNEALAMRLLREHNALLRPIFGFFEGAEVKVIGDSFMVDFPSAVNAVKCGVEVQRKLHERNQAETTESHIVIRIGVHSGDVIFRDGDVFGDGVNVASRIEPLADPGGICVSEDVARQIRNKIESPVVEMGSVTLKNIELPIQVYRIALPWLTSEPTGVGTSDAESPAVPGTTGGQARTPAGQSPVSADSPPAAKPTAGRVQSHAGRVWQTRSVGFLAAVAGIIAIGTFAVWFGLQSGKNTQVAVESEVLADRTAGSIPVAPDLSSVAPDLSPVAPPVAPDLSPVVEAAQPAEPRPVAAPTATEPPAPDRGPPPRPGQTPVGTAAPAAPPPPRAPSPAGLRGTFRDESGLVAGLTVKLTNGRSDVVLETVTSGEGVYELFPIPPGEYTIQFLREQDLVYERPALLLGESQMLTLGVTTDPMPLSPPAPAPRTAAPVEDQTAVVVASIRETLDDYERAYGVDAAGVQRVWPSSDVESLKRNFSAVRDKGLTQRVTLECQEPTLGGNLASVTCNQVVSVSNGAASQSRVEISMENANGSWVIAALTAKP